MRARTLETFEQFEQFHDDGLKHELLEGEHIAVPPANYKHNTISHNLLWLLNSYVKEHQLGDVRIEAGFKLGANNWLQPDVSFIRTAHSQRPQPRGYIEGAPAKNQTANSASLTAHPAEEFGTNGRIGWP